MPLARPLRELILGGQRSGKSRAAERRAADWAAQPGNTSVLIATARADDDEMAARIARHRADRARASPTLALDEAPVELAAALRRWTAPQRLVVIDCLTLWLTNLTMPATDAPVADDRLQRDVLELVDALRVARGPVVLVSNEIGLGVTPLGAATRRFVDELGRLHQAVAEVCDRVTLMVAGIEVAVKRAPA